MEGMTVEEGIAQVYSGGGHVVILGAGASIAATKRNPEKNGIILPSMENFIEVLELEEIFDSIPDSLKNENFEIIYTYLNEQKEKRKLCKYVEEKINNYFHGMELPDVATIYDYLILSMRSRDLIATFNWDPFLYQAWNRTSKITKNIPNIVFLHGNVAIGYSKVYKKSGPIGMSIKSNGKGLLLPTKLLYPIAKKNYTNDEYIKGQWELIKFWLSKESGTVRISIFGYGAPQTDIEAIKMLNTAWGTSVERNMEQVEIIDIQEPNALRERWDSFINSNHYDIVDDYFKSSLALNPRRTSESYFSHYLPQTISQAFRSNNAVPPDFENLDDLWNWHKPLLEAEEFAKKTVQA